MEQQSTVGVLRAAREKITDPNKWTREYSARNADGVGVDPLDPEAVRWCALGAMRVVNPNGCIVGSPYEALTRALNPGSADGIADFNDHRTHEEVLALFDKAIAAEEKEGRV